MTIPEVEKVAEQVLEEAAKIAATEDEALAQFKANPELKMTFREWQYNETELGLMIHNLHRGLKPEMDAVVKAHSSDEGEEAQEYLRRTKIVTDGVFERYDLEKKFGQWDCVRNL